MQSPVYQSRSGIVWSRLLTIFIIVQSVGAVSALATAQSVNTWYQTLRRPPFNPPDWVFAPVWTTLYGLMAVAFYNVWQAPLSHPQRRAAFVAFWIQLALNGVWSPLFFGLRNVQLALVDISLLWVAVGVTTVLFWRVSRLAGLLMTPYWAWVSYATLLNAWIAANN